MKNYLRYTAASLSSTFHLLTDSNAVLNRELRVTLRNERAFALMAVYVAILGAIIASNFPADQAVEIGVRPGSNGVGRSLFGIFWWAQAMLVVLVLPALAAGSLAQERERQTLEPLLLTPLTSSQIVWGKAVGVLLFGALLIMASVPVTSLCFLLNGISPSDVIGAYAVLLGLAAFVTGFGLYCSARWHSGTQAILACYGLLPFALGLLVIFVVAGSLFSGTLLLASMVYWLVSKRSHWKDTRWALKLGGSYTLVFTIAATLFVLVLLAFISGTLGLGGRNLALVAFVMPYLFLVARLGLEQTSKEIEKRPEPRRPTPERINDLKAEWQRAVRPTPVVYLPSPNARPAYNSLPATPTSAAKAVAPTPVAAVPFAPDKTKRPGKHTYELKNFLPDGRNPILAKDLRAGLLGKFSYLGRFSYGIVILSQVWLILQLLLFSYSNNIESIFVAQFKGWAHFHLALVMLAGAILGARSLAPEREQQTLQQLLTTPLLPITIVSGKLMAVLVYTFYVFVMGAPLAVIFAAMGVISPLEVAGFLGFEIAAGALAAAFGIFCSMQGITVRRALGWALGGVTSLFFVNLMVHNVLLAEFSSQATSNRTLITPATRLVMEFDRLVLPFTAMSNILSPAPGVDATAQIANSCISLAIYGIIAAFFLLKTTAGFRQYARTV